MQRRGNFDRFDATHGLGRRAPLRTGGCASRGAEIFEAQHDVEAVCAMLGHVRPETTQIHTQIRPPQIKRAVQV